MNRGTQYNSFAPPSIKFYYVFGQFDCVKIKCARVFDFGSKNVYIWWAGGVVASDANAAVNCGKMGPIHSAVCMQKIIKIMTLWTQKSI